MFMLELDAHFHGVEGNVLRGACAVPGPLYTTVPTRVRL